MRDYEGINTLISYLNALAAVSKCDVRVFEEIKRTVKTLDKLLNQ